MKKSISALLVAGTLVGASLFGLFNLRSCKVGREFSNYYLEPIEQRGLYQSQIVSARKELNELNKKLAFLDDVENEHQRRLLFEAYQSEIKRTGKLSNEMAYAYHMLNATRIPNIFDFIHWKFLIPEDVKKSYDY